MAYSVKASDLPDGDLHAHKVVIVTGPSFGSGLKLVVVGAVLGAAAALYWKNQQESKPTFSPSAGASNTSPAPSSVATRARLRQLAERAKTLAGRASEAIQSAAEIATPALQNALQEAKKAARAAESEIEEEIREMRAQEDKPEQV